MKKTKFGMENAGFKRYFLIRCVISETDTFLKPDFWIQSLALLFTNSVLAWTFASVSLFHHLLTDIYVLSLKGAVWIN